MRADVVVVVTDVAIPSNRGCCPTSIYWLRKNGRQSCRNPLKSGLLSYPIEVKIVASDAGGRNPLKSGLLSYLKLQRCLFVFAKPVAIPSNRGCCPTNKGLKIQHVSVETVAIPSNRGCCPT